jgi:hypothetical protein
VANPEVEIGWFAPDDSGDVFPERLEDALTLGTATFGTMECYTMLAPTGTDIGIYGRVLVPEGYVGTPRIRVKGILGEAANTLAFGVQQLGRDLSEAIDTAWETEDLANNSDWTGLAAEDMFEIDITLTPASAYVAGDEIFFFLYRDDDVDTQTGEFHLIDPVFKYADA